MYDSIQTRRMLELENKFKTKGELTADIKIKSNIDNLLDLRNVSLMDILKLYAY